jgi:(R,R)-butanediol dehydrogenase / meso-butanediol dehydrogenase / diacetyl reductase
MRAAVFHGPGDVRVEDRAAPPAPGPGVLVVDVLRASICGTDAAEYDHGPVLVALDAAGPLILGHEFVGRVTTVGAGVEGLAVGDRVVSGAGVACGRCARCREGRTNLCDVYFTIGLHVDGGLAEQVALPATTCVEVPEGCRDDAAALAQPMAVAIHALNRGGVTAGDTVLVHGCGGIGAFAVAAAARRGTAEIVAADVDPVRLEAARRLGATRLVDVRDENLGDVAVDVALEVSGASSGPGICVGAVRRGGVVVVVGLQREPLAVDLLDVALREIDVRGSLAHVCATDLPEALDVLASGPVAEVMIDRVVGLSRVVDDALVPLAARQVHGKIVVDPRR